MKTPFKINPKTRPKAHPPYPLYQQRLLYRAFHHPILAVISLLIITVALGTVGFMFIEGWSWFDALYMTTITISTIGYSEVQPLSPAGRLFTIILIISGVIIASYALTVSVELFTSERFLGELRNRRKRRALQKINNHCIICGFGRLGSSLANELRARGTQVIAIDLDHETVENCQAMDIPALEGNASDDQMLREAGIKRASSLVAATPSDAENVFIILTAKSIKPNLQIIARCNSSSSIPKMEKAGADTVLSPYAIAGRRVAHMLTHPNVTNFLDGVLEFGDHKMRLEEFVVNANSSIAGLTLQEAKLKVVVLAVDHPDQPVYSRPSAKTRLLPGTEIIVMGKDKDLDKFRLLVENPA